MKALGGAGERCHEGESLWIGRMRADARIFDPSGGNFPPIILGTVI